jgi:hypothetical protein
VIQVIITEVLDGVSVTLEITGSSPSVVVEFAVVVLPAPFALTAETLKLYDVLPISPVTVVDAVVEVPSANVDQVDPTSVLYSII